MRKNNVIIKNKENNAAIKYLTLRPIKSESTANATPPNATNRLMMA